MARLWKWSRGEFFPPLLHLTVKYSGLRVEREWIILHSEKTLSTQSFLSLYQLCLSVCLFNCLSAWLLIHLVIFRSSEFRSLLSDDHLVHTERLITVYSSRKWTSYMLVNLFSCLFRVIIDRSVSYKLFTESFRTTWTPDVGLLSDDSISFLPLRL